MIRIFVAAFVALMAFGNAAVAQNCATYPNTLTNGQPADANQVMANFNHVRGCINSFTGSGREILIANRTYFVRTDGSDSNNGLANTAGGAFLTIQKCVDTIAQKLDVSAFTVTCQVADGTYAGAVELKNVVGFGGAGTLIIQGNSGTPANVIINPVSPTTGAAFFATGLSVTWDIKDLECRATTAGSCIYAINSVVRFGNLRFGAVPQYHVRTGQAAQIIAIGNYAVTGNATRHIAAEYQSYVEVIGRSVTVSPGLAFTAFIVATMAGIADFSVTTVSCTSSNQTGTRFSATTNSIINTNGGGANYFCGNAAGSTTTQGQYL